VQQRVPFQQQTAKVVICLATGQYVDTAQERDYLPKKEYSTPNVQNAVIFGVLKIKP